MQNEVVSRQDWLKARAELLVALKRYAEAADYFEMALALRPDDKKTLEAIIDCNKILQPKADQFRKRIQELDEDGK